MFSKYSRVRTQKVWNSNDKFCFITSLLLVSSAKAQLFFSSCGSGKSSGYSWLSWARILFWESPWRTRARPRQARIHAKHWNDHSRLLCSSGRMSHLPRLSHSSTSHSLQVGIVSRNYDWAANTMFSWAAANTFTPFPKRSRLKGTPH